MFDHGKLFILFWVWSQANSDQILHWLISAILRTSSMM